MADSGLGFTGWAAVLAAVLALAGMAASFLFALRRAAIAAEARREAEADRAAAAALRVDLERLTAARAAAETDARSAAAARDAAAAEAAETRAALAAAEEAKVAAEAAVEAAVAARDALQAETAEARDLLASAEQARTAAEAALAAAVAARDDAEAGARAAAETHRATLAAADVEARRLGEKLAAAERELAARADALDRRDAELRRLMPEGLAAELAALEEAGPAVRAERADAFLARLRPGLAAAHAALAEAALHRLDFEDWATRARLAHDFAPDDPALAAAAQEAASAARLDPTQVAAAASGDARDAARLAVSAAERGLPRLADVLWRRAAETAGPETLALLAEMAEEALWAGRWAEAGAAAARLRAPAADAFGPDARETLAIRLTEGRARLFEGDPAAADLLSSLADDAAEAGVEAAFIREARQLAARALLDAGRADEADAALAALIPEIEAAADAGAESEEAVAARTLAARAALARGRADEARAAFEALRAAAAERYGPDSRKALACALDAAEADVALGDTMAGPSLAALAGPLARAFGQRHPRLGQLALLRGRAAAAVGDRETAETFFHEAEAIWAPVLGPGHPWRRALAAARRQDAPAAAADETFVDATTADETTADADATAR